MGSSTPNTMDSRSSAASMSATPPTTNSTVTPHMPSQVRTMPRPSARPYMTLALRENARTYADAEISDTRIEITSATVLSALVPTIACTKAPASSWREGGR